MYAKRIMFLCLFCIFYSIAEAQFASSTQAADEHSLQLYNEHKWKELLQSGKESISSGVDFPLLRMRTAYAAFMLGNYSESLKHYKSVYDKDKENALALYYVYLNNLYLNNLSAARFYAGKLSTEVKASEKLKAVKVSSAGIEYSYKSPDIIERGNAQYGRASVATQLGYRLELHQSVSFYNQVINEPKLTFVTNNTNINIKQREYYGKLTFAATGNVSVIAGGHYLYIPFNNYIYNNVIGFAGIKYAGPYVQLEGMVHLASIRDTSYNQFDAVVSTNPLGNLNFYTITRGAYSKDFTLTQVVGVKILKNIWLEGNATFGKYNTLIDNDALYVFDDIDIKKSKVGGTLYVLAAKKVRISLNFISENKTKYGTTSNNFHQYSTTGGILWNF